MIVNMKIENNFLARRFYYEGDLFYTVEIKNKILDETIINVGRNEFIVYFSDQTIQTSQEFHIKILHSTEDSINVVFTNDGTSLSILYSCRQDVLVKQITINCSIKKIDYIDVELWDFIDEKDIFLNKKQKDIKEMGGFSGFYVELGQPVYAKSLFWGMEFPLGENRLKESSFISRYYVDSRVENKKMIWPVVIGGSTGFSKEDIQESFFNYIENISQSSYFRKQYNSWYDYMKEIDEKKILNSFKEIGQGFEKNGIHLDCFVVDDGWPNYESFWEFNEKFPLELDRIKKLVNNMNANLGLWIGPRGGYGGSEITMSDWFEKNADFNFGSKNLLTNDVNVGDFNYLRSLKKKMLDYQEKYDISYWKIDGWLLKSDIVELSNDFSMGHMTKVYEYLIDILKELRVERNGNDCWLNLTSYVNPSPWFLQWVNSIWIQTSRDIGFYTKLGGDYVDYMLTYRDNQYYEFIYKRDLKLPLNCLYNHDPIYGIKAGEGIFDHPIFIDIEDFEIYLLFISTRGNALWEFHYSFSMFDNKRWEANARAIKWIESNYSILRNSHMIGGNPSKGEIYGYKCFDKKNRKTIVSVRNPSFQWKDINLKDFDIEIGEFYIVKNRGEIELSHCENIRMGPHSLIILKTCS